MKHTYTAMTCRRAARIAPPPRSYGYTIVISPPRQFVVEGQDIEGLGWWPYRPPKQVTQHWRGWYKFKADAERRAAELNRP